MASVEAIRRAGTIAMAMVLAIVTGLPAWFLAWQYTLASRYTFTTSQFTLADELHGAFVVVSGRGRTPARDEIDGRILMDTVTPFGGETFGLHEYGVPAGVPMTVTLATYRMGKRSWPVVAGVRSAGHVFVQRSTADCAELARRSTRQTLRLETGFVAAWIIGIWAIALQEWSSRRRKPARPDD